MSARETQILVLFAQGLSDKQAARALGISDLTVRKHRSNLQQKLQVSNVCALLFEAVENGWLVLPASHLQR
ncbi:response regulator transcription factor [Pseudomonas sp. BMS12]|uniref:response regulator transcription factor n=1 Tax=Pseudomonas sp. BMS12 TaxID=1796033 RepID=UPI0009EE3A11|nr:LuxR C-terminal-related transcriptional regulator [Pseudomonas sp. BMS12]